MLANFSLQLRRRYWREVRRLRRLQSPQSPSILKGVWRQTDWHVQRPWQQQEYLVVDAETSGLEVARSELLSLGWVAVRDGVIPLETARHILIRPEPGQGVGDSATVHQLRDCELEGGLSEAGALLQLLQAARGRVLVFHHAPLDMAFLNRASWRAFRLPLLLPVIDTMAIEQRRLEHQQQPLMRNALRLSSCCARYGLPPGTVHNALSDALATAQLLLAQVAHKGEGVKLRDLL